MAEALQLNEKSITCLNCTFKAVNATELFKHVRIHQYDRNFRIACPHCPQILKSLVWYRTHVKSCLKTLAAITYKHIKQAPSETIEKNWHCTTLNCSECINISDKTESAAFKVVVEHLNQHVRKEIKVICPVALCGMSYLKYKSFNMHYNRHKHRQEFTLKQSIQKISSNDQPNDELAVLEIGNDPFSNEALNPSNSDATDNKILKTNDSSFEIQTADYSVFEIHRIEAAFALKLMAKHMLPQDVVSDILAFSGSIHNAKIAAIKASLKKKFDTENLTRISREIDVVENNSGLKGKIATHHQRMQLIKKRFEYIEPLRHEIGRIRGIASFYMRLPISKTLARQLTDESLREYIINDPVFASPQNVCFLVIQGSLHCIR